MPGRTFQWGLFGIALIMVFGIYLVSKEAAVLQQEIYAKLEDKFGFTTSSAAAQIGDQLIESFSVAPEAGSLLYNAGFREGDIILSHTKQKFFRLLYEKKARPETIEIVREIVGSADQDIQVKTIYFQLPE